MPTTTNLFSFYCLVAALIGSAWDLSAEGTNGEPRSVARRTPGNSAPRGSTKSDVPIFQSPDARRQTNPPSPVEQGHGVPVSANPIPPAPPGVTDLKFSDIFKPVGPRGLEYSDKARALDGKKVRILGYMVRQTEPVPWMFLLAPVPVTLHEKEYGLAEDMPAPIVHVTTQRNATPIVPHTPGLLLLTGALSLGNREEAGGRISSVRLALDPPTPEQRAALNQLAGSQRAATIPSISLSTNTAPK